MFEEIDYVARNMQILQEAMEELDISDCEEIPAKIRELKEQSVYPTGYQPRKKGGSELHPPSGGSNVGKPASGLRKPLGG